MAELVPHANVNAEFTSFDSPVLDERFNDAVVEALRPLPQNTSLRPDPTRQRARGYYSEAAIRIDAERIEIGDGGFTDWTAKLMADSKERCFISCVSTERLTALVEASR